MADRVGQQLGNYRLLRLLGRGGFAEVYLGEHIYLNNYAALKVLHTVLKDEERTNFLKEAQTLVRLSHPHIVHVLDFAVEEGTLFLVMEYAPNGTLGQRHPVGTRLTLDTIGHYIQQVASALHYAHSQRLIHRDVKPENMLIDAQNNILLSDFGLTLLAQHTHPYSTHQVAQQVAGTSLYLAPEQLQGHPRTASDQYALGIVVYEWLCGTAPFRGTPLEIATQHLTMAPPSLRGQLPDLAPAVEEVVLRALAKEPEQRFSDIQEFALALERASHATPPTFSQPKEQAASTDHQQAHTQESIQKPKPIWKVPALFTSFIGREQDVADICALLQQPEVRLLTLLGPGGIGKTRLSVQVATELRDAFADGICFIHLAAVYDPKLVISAIAEELEIREVGAQSLLDQVKVSLRDKRFLLVLDNFEQLVEAVPQVEELLIACPTLKILVTSRAVLHVQGEQEFSVSPLALPNLKQLPEESSLSQFAAVALFIQRARAVLPSFQLNTTNAHAIAEICVRLDGLPLAIELAAARIKLLPPQALLSRLSQRLQVLTSNTRTLPERQQTLRNTLKWSYDLLAAQEQQFFRRLSVFVGGWTLEAAESVVEHTIDNAAFSLLDAIASLLDKSLLIQVEHEGWEPYLIMLETIREYGMECLIESGETLVFQRAHALYYLAWVEQAEPHLKDAQQLTWLARLEREQENLRAALQWLIDQQETELALRFCDALWRFWLIRGYWSEGRRWLEAALKLLHGEQPTEARARALCGAGRFAIRLGGFAVGRSLLESGVALYRQLGDKQGLAESLIMWDKNSRNAPVSVHAQLEESVVLAREIKDEWTLANSLQDLGWFELGHNEPDTAQALLEESAAIFRQVGDTHSLISTLTAFARTTAVQENFTQAVALAQECLTLARSMNNKPDIAEALYNIGAIKAHQGDLVQAIAYLQELLVLARELGDKYNIAAALGNLGEIALSQSNLAQAEAVTCESLQYYRELEDTSNIANSLSSLGDIKWTMGDSIKAVAYYSESLLLAQEVGSKINIGFNIVGLARVAVAEGQFERATLLFGAAESLNPYIGMHPDMRSDYEQAMRDVRLRLGEQAFVAAWKQGEAMKLEQVIAVALKEEAIPSMPTSPVSQTPKDVKLPARAAYPDNLTEREVEVLRLVAQGLSDPQIADQLIISPRTVNAHLTSIYRKIQVSSRSAATRYALEHHLV